MLTALVLICSVLVTPDLADCNPDNARAVMLVPEQFSNPAMCAMVGQAYVAQTTVGRNLSENDRVKVVCRPSRPGEPPIAEREPRAKERARHGGLMVDEE